MKMSFPIDLHDLGPSDILSTSTYYSQKNVCGFRVLKFDGLGFGRKFGEGPNSQT